MIRMVALGDSTTAGTPGFRSPLEAPPDGRGDPESQYAWWLAQARPDWEVLNRGVNGERSDQIRARFARDVLLAAPAIVIIIAGVNDVYQGLPSGHVVDQLGAMYRLAAERGIRAVAGTIVPFNTASADQNARMREVNSWIRRYCESDPNVAFVDTRASVADPNHPDRLLASPDDLHPSPDGYRRMAEALLPVLDRISDLTGRTSANRL